MRIASKMIALVVVAVLVVALVLVALPGSLLGRLGLSNPFGAEEVDRSSPALLERIQDVSRLESAVGSFEVVVDTEQDVRFVPGFLAGERSLFVAQGTVDAYVDLSGLTEGDLELAEDGGSVTIRLPEAQLGSPNLDPSRTRLYSQERGLLNMGQDFFDAPDQSDLYAEAEAKVAAAAAESDLRAQARDNAEKVLGGLLGELGVEATFVDADQVE